MAQLKQPFGNRIEQQDDPSGTPVGPAQPPQGPPQGPPGVTPPPPTFAPPPAPGDLGESPTSRGGETPRDRGEDPSSTLRRPAQPAPGAGSTAQPGVTPFQPMPGSSEIGISSPAQSGLFGGQGGLTGGGLGMPLSHAMDNKSPDIQGLLQMLQKMGQGGGGGY